MITAENLSLQYRYAQTAFRNVSFCADVDQPLIVLGEKDAGKTSLWNAVAGCTTLLQGKILFDGAEKPVRERNICYLREGKNFFSLRSVRYNIEYPLKLRNQTKKPYRFLTDAMEKKKIFRLGKEERLAVLFERVYQRDADVLIWDNPFSAWEGEERKKVFDLYFPFLQEQIKKHTVLFATSSLYEAEKFRRKIVFMAYGFFLQEGTVDEIRSQPATLSLFRYFYPTVEIREKILTVGDIAPEEILHPVFYGNKVYYAEVDGKPFFYDYRSERYLFA